MNATPSLFSGPDNFCLTRLDAMFIHHGLVQALPELDHATIAASRQNTK
jgi:hypothetical protein